MTNDHPNPAYVHAAQQLDELHDGFPFVDRFATAEPIVGANNVAEQDDIQEGRIQNTPPVTKNRAPASAFQYPIAKEVLIVNSGVNLVEHMLGFDCRAIGIQNLGSNRFIYNPDTATFMTAGATLQNVFNLPNRTQRLTLQWTTSITNFATPAAVPGEFAVVYLYDEWVIPLSADSTLLVPNQPFPTPAVKTDTVENAAVTEIGVMNQVFNGATWARMRAAAANADPGQVGVLAVGLQAADNPNNLIRRLFTASSLADGHLGANVIPEALLLYDATAANYARARSVAATDSVATIPSVGIQRNQIALAGFTPNDNRPLTNVPANVDGSTLPNALPIASWGFVGGSGLWDRMRAGNVFKPQNAVAVNPEATVWTPAVGRKFRLLGANLAGSVVGNYVFRDNTAGTIIAVVAIGVAGTTVAVTFGNGILSAVANNVLTCTGPAASTLSGTIWGTEE